MLDLRFRPLLTWTRSPNLERRKSAFKTHFNRSLEILEYELRKLQATHIVIEAGFPLEHLRGDGWPVKGKIPVHPGVVLYFRSADGSMEFPCGTYAGYQANIHAIALTLENLRAIDRYGVTLGHQQYKGFLALPAAASTSDSWTVDGAAAWLASRTGDTVTAEALLKNYEVFRRTYRDLARTMHPDRLGSREMYDVLQLVSRMLEEHHKQKSKHAGGV